MRVNYSLLRRFYAPVLCFVGRMCSQYAKASWAEICVVRTAGIYNWSMDDTKEAKTVKKITLYLCNFLPIAVCILFAFFATAGRPGEFWGVLASILFLIGIIGSTVAGFNGRTTTAVISGIVILITAVIYGITNLMINLPQSFVGNFASFFMGSLVLATAFVTHTNKKLAKLRVLYFTPIAMMVFLVFKNADLFNIRLDVITMVMAKPFLLFWLWAAWNAVVGFDRFVYQDGSVSIDTTEKETSSDTLQSSIQERITKKLKRSLKIALFIFVFAIAGFYSDIFFAVVRYTHMNFTSTWTAPEPLGLENWIDHAADSFAGGSGTRQDPFLISTPEQLAYLARRVNTGTLERTHIKISNDIDLTGREWTPIGTKQHPFSGRVDGGDAVIYNLTIATSQNRQGLFGVVSVGVLENLTLVNANIKGRDFVGGIAGVFSNGSMSNSSLTGTVEGRYFVGGVTGYGFFHSILFSTYLGNVKGDVYVGGLVGKHTINEGDRFLAFAYASQAPIPVELQGNVVIAAVSGRKYVGGLVGHSGKRTLISNGFFAGKIRGEAFSAGISGFFPSDGRGIREANFVLLYDMPDSTDFTEIAHSDHHRISADALRHLNGKWFLNSNLLPIEEAENKFLVFLNFQRREREQIYGRYQLTENALKRLLHPFYVLNIPYGMEVSQDAPLSVEFTENGFNSSLDSFLGGRFWVDNDRFNMSGSMRDIPKGVYAVPCFRDLDGRFETIWVLLNVN